jgi:hypothetical protein
VTTLEYFKSAAAFIGEPLFGFLPVFCFKYKPYFSNNNTLNKYFCTTVLVKCVIVIIAEIRFVFRAEHR